MTELVSSKLDNRVIFPAGEQNKFLEKARRHLSLSWPLLAKKIGVHQRTMSDWKREQYSMPLGIVKNIAAEAHVGIPLEVELKDRYWYTGKAGFAGGIAVIEKYGQIGGNPEYRKKKWHEWWEREGKDKSIIASVKPITKPRASKELAEFVGIMMGDGGITKKQVTITLNKNDDKLYVSYVAELIKNLFNVEPSLSDRESVTNIVVSRIQLVGFCYSIGLKIGNKVKQNFDIPEWIKKKRLFQIACLRGLVDTDGCIFQEIHRLNGKEYRYPRLAFTSSSNALRSSVFKVFKELEFSPKIRSRRNVQLERRKDIERYFQLMGTSNPKHRERFTKFMEGSDSGLFQQS